jgi:hypothetical protein
MHRERVSQVYALIEQKGKCSCFGVHSFYKDTGERFSCARTPLYQFQLPMGFALETTELAWQPQVLSKEAWVAGHSRCVLATLAWR